MFTYHHRIIAKLTRTMEFAIPRNHDDNISYTMKLGIEDMFSFLTQRHMESCEFKQKNTVFVHGDYLTLDVNWGIAVALGIPL